MDAMCRTELSCMPPEAFPFGAAKGEEVDCFLPTKYGKGLVAKAMDNSAHIYSFLFCKVRSPAVRLLQENSGLPSEDNSVKQLNLISGVRFETFFTIVNKGIFLCPPNYARFRTALKHSFPNHKWQT